MTKLVIPLDVEEGCLEVRQALNRLEHKAATMKSEALVKAHPDSFAVWAARGGVLYELGKLDEAQKAFERAWALVQKFFAGRVPSRLRWSNPGERHALRALHGNGLVLYRRGDANAAQKYFEQEVRLNPSDEQAAKYVLRDIKAGRAWKTLGASTV